jgi:hypothetical protein
MPRLMIPKRFLSGIVMVATGLTACRTVVLLCESFSEIYAERNANSELLQICASGSARESADFRSLCIKKRAQMSTPIIVSTVLRAFNTAFLDFMDAISNPYRFCVFLVFCLTGAAAPMIKLASGLLMELLKRRRTNRYLRFITARHKKYDDEYDYNENDYNDDDDSEDEERSSRIIFVHGSEGDSAPARLRSSCRSFLRRRIVVPLLGHQQHQHQPYQIGSSPARGIMRERPIISAPTSFDGSFKS